MPILANTHSHDPALLRASFLPFARPDYVEGMIIGDDLDSLLSAMYLHHIYGWPIAGVYCQYTRLWHVEPRPVFLEKLLSGRLFAVDLDIYHPTVPSLGHHIISLKNDDELPGHSHSLNPNALRGFSIRQHFRRKYPLATIHFLLWLMEEKSLAAQAEMLVWLADSCFINAQQYRQNVEEWILEFFKFPLFSSKLPDLQTLDFEKQLQEKILQPMLLNPLARPGKSKYKSLHLGINGFQCQFANPNRQNADLQNLLQLLAQLTDWPHLPFPTNFSGCIAGRRQEITVREINGPFGDWLEHLGVFSYAFTFKDRLNITIWD